MDAQVQAFISRWNGYPLEAEDSSNLDQCFDLAFGWCDALGIPRETIRHLDAYQIFTLATEVTHQYFDLVANTPADVPPAGALIIWKANGRFTGAAGHVDLARPGSTTAVMNTFDQNWAGHLYCEIMTHPYDDVIGWLIPKATNQGTTNVANPTVTNPVNGDTRDVNGWYQAYAEADADRVRYLGQYNQAETQVTDLTSQVQSQQATIDQLNAKLSEPPATSPATPVVTPPVDTSTGDSWAAGFVAWLKALVNK